jgi:hypothetical protein
MNRDAVNVVISKRPFAGEDIGQTLSQVRGLFHGEVHVSDSSRLTIIPTKITYLSSNPESRDGVGRDTSRMESPAVLYHVIDGEVQLSWTSNSTGSGHDPKKRKMHCEVVKRGYLFAIRNGVKYQIKTLQGEATLLRGCVSGSNGTSPLRKRKRQTAEKHAYPIQRSGFELAKESMKTLDNGKKLNDEVIDLASMLLNSRHYHEKKFLVARTHLFSNFVTGGLPKFDLRMWFPIDGEKVVESHGDILRVARYITPVHLGGDHWTTAVFDVRKGKSTITYYDSLRMRTPSRDLKRFYVALKKDVFGEDVGEQDIDMRVIADGPRQRGGVDCGVFMLMFAENLMEGGDIDFTQDDVSDYRKLIRYRIENNAI